MGMGFRTHTISLPELQDFTRSESFSTQQIQTEHSRQPSAVSPNGVFANKVAAHSRNPLPHVTTWAIFPSEIGVFGPSLTPPNKQIRVTPQFASFKRDVFEFSPHRLFEILFLHFDALLNATFQGQSDSKCPKDKRSPKNPGLNRLDNRLDGLSDASDCGLKLSEYSQLLGFRRAFLNQPF